MENVETPAADANTPIFSLQKIYVKDLSFENPNAPEAFAAPAGQPKVEMNLELSNRQLDAEHWEVTLKVSAITREEQSDKLMFEIEVEHAALFFLQNIPAEHIPALLSVDCPTILFPYTRQIFSQLTVDGGFMPFLLDPVNFAGIYAQQAAEAEAKANVN